MTKRKTSFVPRGTKENPVSLEVRFWAKVNKAGLNECWNWYGAKGRDGYGQIWSGGSTAKGNRRSIGAHVASLLVHNIPNHRNLRCALHSCNNKLCVNPNHLSWGTNRQNTLDAIRDGLMIPIRPMRR